MANVCKITSHIYINVTVFHCYICYFSCFFVLFCSDFSSRINTLDGYLKEMEEVPPMIIN